MSAGKLSRIAGSVFVLAAVFGGIGASIDGAGHGTGGSDSVSAMKVVDDAGQIQARANLNEVIWT